VKTYSIGEALEAQRALRNAAGLGEEEFPIEAFVGMISDEIQALREAGRTDEQIAELITSSSEIEISASEIKDNYATPEERHQH
jgi:hypothetical protein